MQNKEKQLMHDISIRQVPPIDTLQSSIRFAQLPYNLHRFHRCIKSHCCHIVAHLPTLP